MKESFLGTSSFLPSSSHCDPALGTYSFNTTFRIHHHTSIHLFDDGFDDCMNLFDEFR